MAEYAGAFPVTLETLPVEMIPKFEFDVGADELKAHLKAGGSLILDGTTLTIGKADFDRNTEAILVCDEIELRNGATIVTGGSLLILFCNRFKSQDGRIVSFAETDLTAAPGSNGSQGSPGSGAGSPGVAGRPGDHGGIVNILVFEELEGFLNVDLRGQSGGDGGTGGSGGQGRKGARGRDGVDEMLWCASGGQSGHQGERGGAGGNGGNGGTGGQGGTLLLYSIGGDPVDEANFKYTAPGGAGGKGGPGAAGGPGGEGGDGGSGSKFCSGGGPGPTGLAGPAGQRGSDGDTGADGNRVIRSVSLDFALRVAGTGVVPVN